MGRIARIFEDIRVSNNRGLVPFICGGHPRSGVTRRIIPALARAGASIIEVGIPFSDPIADGPVIAAAMHTAISEGATPRSVLEEVAAARVETDIGLVAMVSESIVHRMGGEPEFVRCLAQAGFDGVIVPDAPLEESEALRRAAAGAGLTATLMVSPTTPLDRAERIARASTGFVYLLARTGITGERGDAPDVAAGVLRLRRVTDLPIAVGFGISSAGHVREVVRHAEAAIVGSALVRRIGGSADPVAAGEAFVRDLAEGLRGG